MAARPTWIVRHAYAGDQRDHGLRVDGSQIWVEDPFRVLCFWNAFRGCAPRSAASTPVKPTHARIDQRGSCCCIPFNRGAFPCGTSQALREQRLGVVPFQPQRNSGIFNLNETPAFSTSTKLRPFRPEGTTECSYGWSEPALRGRSATRSTRCLSRRAPEGQRSRHLRRT